MAPTYTTDISAWIPGVISAAAYDLMLANPENTLARLAGVYGDLEGQAGSAISIPTVNVTTPADDLAENVAAVDDKISGSAVTVTIKEAVKSIAYSDRTRFQAGQNVSQIAGQRLGRALEDRFELDLGAALLAGRNVAADTWLGVAPLDLSDVRTMRLKIPSRLRRRGVVMLAEDDVMSQLLADATVNNAAAFGSDEAIRDGAFSRPLYGITPYSVDDTVLGNVTIATHTGPAVVFMARGMLIKAFQKNPSAEVERDARARLTRIVGMSLHGEGVLEAAGVVVGNVAP